MLRSLSVQFGWNQQRRRSARTLSPLHLPEILVIIFSYLTDHALRRSVAPVCRLWLYTVQNVMVREVVWDSDWKDIRGSEALSTLPGAERLICHNHIKFTDYSEEHPLMSALRQLEAEYQERLNGSNSNSQKQVKQDVSRSLAEQTPHRFFFHKNVPLQHLELVTTKFSSTLFDQFPFPTSLTSIKLAFCRRFGSSFSLTRILILCPLLVSFHAKCQINVSIEVTLEPFGQQHVSTTATTTTGQQQQQEDKRQLVLRSLVLEGLSLNIVKFEDLLTVTPHLKELKLIDIASYWFSPRSWSGLLKHLKTLPCKLESTHFSSNGQGTNAGEMETMLTLHPMSSEWSLWGLDVQPSLLQSLEITANVVTKLELHWSYRAWGYGGGCHRQDLQSAPKLIHKYLCNSPHLVHLRVVKSVFLIEDMDLFGRRTFGDLSLPNSNSCNSSSPDPAPDPTEASGTMQIWQCRNLRTLQFEINAHLDVMPMADPVQSRILFGYISRVCPNLEDLYISCPTVCIQSGNSRSYIPRLSLELDGGICLLSRLQLLRRLKIEDYYLCQGPDCEVYEMNWIVPSGRDSWSRMKRQKVMLEWGSKESEEARLETERKKNGGLKKLIPVSQAKEDVRLAKDLQDLGLIVDVRNMVKEMDGNYRFVCFPQLERMSFEYPIDNSPRNELLRLFPKNSRLDGNSLIWF
ncbi:hypothetical protein BG015_011409 [Linnemannia schmuckeri]|uniref:F-box domain-containing protein n=1 Tax=Linnemannia schmuckeri TaxID=64567 RepID=A0A9P5RSR0_9FUNG|nr:hypothetical protein BG015_011409 [Linnemannia schmuckeri]